MPAIGRFYEFSWMNWLNYSQASVYISRDNGENWDFVSSVNNDDTPDKVNYYFWPIIGPTAAQCQLKFTQVEGGVELFSSVFEITDDPAISYFSRDYVAVDQVCTASINLSVLVSTVQAHSADTYFDTTSKVGRVVIFYNQYEGRQVKKLSYESPSFTTNVSWSSYARDGTWEKNKVIVYNHEGATHTLPRSALGASEDIVRVGSYQIVGSYRNTMVLNRG